MKHIRGWVQLSKPLQSLEIKPSMLILAILVSDHSRWRVPSSNEWPFLWWMNCSKAGQLTPEEAEAHPQKSIITQSIGQKMRFNLILGIAWNLVTISSWTVMVSPIWFQEVKSMTSWQVIFRRRQEAATLYVLQTMPEGLITLQVALVD